MTNTGATTGTAKISKKKRPWIRSVQGWSWVITIAWMAVANIWKPFGLFGFVCMASPIGLVLLGFGKMHCARVCPRGSLIGRLTARLSLGLKKPVWMATRGFHWLLWGLMMGSFLVALVVAVPQGVAVLGNTVLIFMEVATGIAILFGVLFQPRAWCTVCPMGFTSGNLRSLVRKPKKAA
jgi:hypothetical protein